MPSPHSSDRNAHFPIEHGVPTICHSPQNVCVQIKKLLQCSEPLSLKGIMRNDNCKQACPSICKNNCAQKSSEAHWADGKPHLSAKQDRLSALHPALLWHWAVFNRQWKAWASQLRHQKEEARKGPGEKWAKKEVGEQQEEQKTVKSKDKRQAHTRQMQDSED